MCYLLCFAVLCLFVVAECVLFARCLLLFVTVCLALCDVVFGLLGVVRCCLLLCVMCLALFTDGCCVLLACMRVLLLFHCRLLLLVAVVCCCVVLFVVVVFCGPSVV